MGNKIQYFLICVMAILAISACTPSDSTKFPKIGNAVPNISWTTIYGEKIDLKQFKGDWVLLCYWCDCRVHRGDILTLRDIYDALYMKNLDIIIIDDSLTAETSMKDYSSENKSPFYCVADHQKSINEIVPLDVERGGRPIYLLIDMNGNLHDVNIGTFLYTENSIDNEIKFLTDVIEVNISDITISNVSSNRATVRWKTDKAVPCWLEVISQTEKAKLGYCTDVTEQGTNHEYILDCRPNTTYIINVATKGLVLSDKLRLSIISDTYLYNRSREYSFTTLAEEYDKERSEVGDYSYKADLNISNVKISNITDASVELYWETNEEATGSAVLHGSETSNELSLYKKDFNYAKHHTLIVDNLQPNTGYSVYLQSTSKNGSYANTSFGFRTKHANYVGRTEIFNIDIYEITDNSAKVRWSTSRPVTCEILVQGRQTCSDNLHDRHTSHSCTLANLRAETEYTIDVKAYYYDNDSTTLSNLQFVSDTSKFKTLAAVDKVDMK